MHWYLKIVLLFCFNVCQSSVVIQNGRTTVEMMGNDAEFLCSTDSPNKTLQWYKGDTIDKSIPVTNDTGSIIMIQNFGTTRGSTLIIKNITLDDAAFIICKEEDASYASTKLFVIDHIECGKTCAREGAVTTIKCKAEYSGLHHLELSLKGLQPVSENFSQSEANVKYRTTWSQWNLNRNCSIIAANSVIGFEYNNNSISKNFSIAIDGGGGSATTAVTVVTPNITTATNIITYIPNYTQRPVVINISLEREDSSTTIDSTTVFTTTTVSTTTIPIPTTTVPTTTTTQEIVYEDNSDVEFEYDYIAGNGSNNELEYDVDYITTSVATATETVTMMMPEEKYRYITAIVFCSIMFVIVMTVLLILHIRKRLKENSRRYPASVSTEMMPIN